MDPLRSDLYQIPQIDTTMSENSTDNNEKKNTTSDFIDDNYMSSIYLHHTPTLAVSKKSTRKKWKLNEDIVLLKSTLECHHLLTYVEFFKPMKNFWIKVSKHLLQVYRVERNNRQCHDRFNVLFAKSHKMLAHWETSNKPPSEIEKLLSDIKKTFSVSNGNISLLRNNSFKNLTSDSHSLPSTSSHDLISPSMTESLYTEIRMKDAMIQSFHQIFEDLQCQINDLKKRVNEQRHLIDENHRITQEFCTKLLGFHSTYSRN